MAQMIMPSAVPADPGRHRAGLEPDHPNTLTSRNNLCRRYRGNERLKDHPQASSFRHHLAGELDYWVSDRSEWWGRVRGLDGHPAWIRAADLPQSRDSPLIIAAPVAVDSCRL